ncbi:hypothetical protein PFISCL1PPCAC_26929 [Pristionchus fissidentatus]|uniref:t-SNARE coiled-coil homology domain-containing protein n=1 Tax=Pristionchus fissidentatus TaxID=1538716 RepID=A0AAV5WUF8_9BILA|nr:hypothetical protein PFISCL1PPCAC_26929 [Pristionchus fissidentatus]
MTKDRISDVKVMTRQTRGRKDSTDSEDESSNEKGRLLSPENWETVDQYLELSMRLRADMETMEEELKEIHKLHAKLLSIPSTPALTKELNEKTSQLQSKLRSITAEMKILNKEIGDAKDETPTVNNRIKRDQVTHLNRVLINITTKFSEEQVAYKEKSRKKYTEYLRVLNTDLPDDVLDDALENGTLSETIKGVILAREEKKALLDEVKQRTDDIQTIEKSIRELGEMFHDLHLLVCSQGEMLNNIESNVNRCIEYAVKARTDIVAAQKMKRRAQMMKIGLIFGVIILVIILFLVGKMLFCFYLPFLCG